MLTRSKRWLATLLAAISTAALAGAEWVTNFDPWLLLAVGMSVAFCDPIRRLRMATEGIDAVLGDCDPCQPHHHLYFI
jgi:hypothetical protein